MLPLPHVATHPTNASQVLDPRLASFSLEFAYVTAFGGNKTHPNLLTKELMQRLAERTGAGPVSGTIAPCRAALTRISGRSTWWDHHVSYRGHDDKVMQRTNSVFRDSSIFSPDASALDLSESPVSAAF